MKANDAFNNIDLSGALLPASYEPFADYLVKFIEAYRAQGIPIGAITPENEPNAPSVLPGMYLTPAQEAQLVAQNLAPSLAAAGLHPKIYGLDDTELPQAQALVASQARGALAGIAWHCYQGLGQMSALHQTDAAAGEILNECSPGMIAYSVSELAIDATDNWASVVALWNLARDPSGGPAQVGNGCPGCTRVVTISEQTHAATVGQNYYQFGQISKHVQPGGVRIASTRLVHDYAYPNGVFRVSAGVDDVAFKNPDGQKVLITYNNSRSRQRFAVSWRGRQFAYTLQAGATVTFTWR